MNKEGLILGHSNLSLNNTGLQQARSVALSLQVERPFAIYSSPLARAMETAQIISQINKIPVVPLEGLMEMNAGSLEGLTSQEARQLYPDVMKKWDEDSGSTNMPNGESLSQVQNRAWVAVQRMLDTDAGGKAAVVTHNFVILTVVCKVLGLPLSSFRRFRIGLGSLTTLEIDNNGATIISLNESRHLYHPIEGD